MMMQQCSKIPPKILASLRVAAGELQFVPRQLQHSQAGLLCCINSVTEWMIEEGAYNNRCL
jgi:hypothetical protein